MAQVSTQVLFPHTAYPGPTGRSISLDGSKAEAAAFYLANRDVQTVTWSLGNGNGNNNNNNNIFVGTIKIQASLVTSPGSTDWFDIYDIDTNAQPQVGYVNLRGNYVWLRAIVRNWTGGFIQQITVSY